VITIFDSYAERFDQHLVGALQYRVPRRVAESLKAKHPDGRFNLLDLGCGTGQVAAYLGRIQGHIIGVDLSDKMIEQAGWACIRASTRSTCWTRCARPGRPLRGHHLHRRADTWASWSR
jgi:ubiquinone/menaquinone biosynthesis C-methylase UbiE